MKTATAGGFTLIELSMVLLIMGILSTFGVPKLFSSHSLTRHAQAELMASDLRRIQWMATTRSSNVCVEIQATQYSVHPFTTYCNAAIHINDPATGNPFLVVMPSQTTLSDALSATPFYFDSLGRPNREGAFELTSPDRSARVTVRVTPLTGFITTHPSP